MAPKVGRECGSGRLSVATDFRALQDVKPIYKSIPMKVLCESHKHARLSGITFVDPSTRSCARRSQGAARLL
jgi:hypothetical protein